MLRLPLYEGVDWNAIACSYCRFASVSLFTREWIEISARLMSESAKMSPSLRGSGLKWGLADGRIAGMGLPLYEGVDWNDCRTCWQRRLTCLPLYEGVDWNRLRLVRTVIIAVSLFTREWIEIINGRILFRQRTSPSLRGSGLKFFDEVALMPESFVSLFTREWIEIHAEGWKTEASGSPSLRGSGLKLLILFLLLY